MALKGRPIAIGTSDTTIYTCPATIEASIHGLVFANNTGSSVTVTIKVYIQSLGTTATVATGVTVAANSTYTWPKPININAGDYVQAAASTGSAIVCLYSVYEGGATPSAVGFTPRGAWSSGASYVANDVVSYNGSSYLAIQPSTNQLPTTTAYWLVLASKGDTGAAGTNGTNGTGDVNGPASAVDSELALFDSTTGKLIKRASFSGLVKATSGVASSAVAGTDYLAPSAIGTTVQAWDADLDTWATKTAPSGTVVGTSDTQTLSAKTLTGLRETRTTPSISSGTLTLDCSAGNVFAVSLNANITTLTFTNVPASGTAFGLTLALTADGTARTVTWGAAVKWPGGTAPTLTSTNGKVDVFVLTTWDGGTTWYAVVGGQNL